METLTIQEILDATGGRLLCGSTDIQITDITTDSRNAGENTLFIAFKGERVDGNDFAAQFLQAGAAAIVGREIPYDGSKPLILVQDTQKAIQSIAAYYRTKFPIPVVGITGSVGKTSTKDMVYAVLSQSMHTLKTQGNFNNEIGLPLTVFRLDNSYETAILEMGMSAFGELRALTNIAKPSVAVITNIGTAHIGNLGSQDNILKAKLEILEGLADGGIVILNADDALLYGLKGKLSQRTVYYGIDNTDADFTAYNIIIDDTKTSFCTKIQGGEYQFTIPVVGQHHIYNAMVAIITALQFGMPVDKIQQGVASYESNGLRQNITDVGGVKVIEDCYNASTTSMEASMKVLTRLAEGRRSIAVLGDILELGEFAEECHRFVGKTAAALGVNMLVTIGNDTRFTADEAKKNGLMRVVSFPDNETAAGYLLKTVQGGDVVLFKGSRGMQLETVSKQLIEGLSQNG